MAYVGSLSLLFSILLILEIYGEIIENYFIIWIVKPLLMPVLLLLFLLNVHHNLSIERFCLIISLIFSCIGDILLMQRQNHLFVFGLASFLIVHISYVISFLVQLRHEGEAFKRRLTNSTIIKTMIPFLAYISLMLYVLCPKLHTDKEETKGLLLPVIFYTFVVVGMAYISYLRDRKTPGFWSVFIGAVFFVLSDTLIAFNRFVLPIPIAGLFVMFTYGLGQYLITIGTLQITAKHWKTR